MQLLDTDLTQNEVKTDSEVGSLFLKPNKLGATVEKEASTTFALCVEEPLRYFSVWAVPPGTAADDYMSARTFQFTEMPDEDTILTVLGGDWERKRKSFWDAKDPKNVGKERPFENIDRVLTWPIYSYDEQRVMIFAVDKVSKRTVVAVDERYFRPAEVESLLGDPTKAKQKLGWEPTTTFDQLVEDMCIYGQ